MNINGITVGTQERLFLPKTACKASYWAPPVAGQLVKAANLHFSEGPEIIKDLMKEKIESVEPIKTNCPQWVKYCIKTSRSVILVDHIIAPRYDPRKPR